jgi:hypothetical protein
MGACTCELITKMKFVIVRESDVSMGRLALRRHDLALTKCEFREQDEVSTGPVNLFDAFHLRLGRKRKGDVSSGRLDLRNNFLHFGLQKCDLR